MTVKTVRRLVADSTGAAAVMLALSMPVVVGGLGLGTEVGMWYFNQRKLQNAADIAAYAAAAELRAGRGASRIEAAALDAAARTGYLADRGGALAVVTPYNGNFNEVEVRVRERLPRLLTGLFARGEVELGGRAVARISEGIQSCVLALDPSAPGAVTFIGNATSILVGCNVHANSLAEDGVSVEGSSEVETACLSSSGGVSVTGGSLELTECVAPYEHADQVPDPYQDLPAPLASGGCIDSPENTPQTTMTVSPGRFCSGMDLKGDITLQPGVYIVEGKFTINSTAKVQGDGVTFYFPGSADITLNGNATVDLKAPSSGDYQGMLFFFDRNGPNETHKVNGTFGAGLNGAIYARNAAIEILGDSGTTVGCTQVVARTIKFSGNSKVSMDCSAANVRDIRSARLITLVE